MKKSLFTAMVGAALAFTLSMAFVSCKEKSSSDEAKTPAQALVAQFNTISSDKSCMEIAEALSENKCVDFMPAVMEVEEGWLNGITDEINGFSEGALFAPMIGSIPFISYVFKTDNTKALEEQLKNKADLRWNICTQADEMLSAVKGDKVFFVMAPLSFEE